MKTIAFTTTCGFTSHGHASSGVYCKDGPACSMKVRRVRARDAHVHGQPRLVDGRLPERVLT